MELRILKNFLVVVREENISRAAEVLHIAQPALSRQMSQLEEELGTQLFIRGKRLVLTDAGIMLRQLAEEVTSLIAKIKNEFEEQTETGGIISIGGGGLTALQSLTPIFDSFRRKYPKVQYHFYTNSADYIKEKLEQGLLDFGVLLEPTDVSKFDYLRMPVKENGGFCFRRKARLPLKETLPKKIWHLFRLSCQTVPLFKKNWKVGLEKNCQSLMFSEPTISLLMLPPSSTAAPSGGFPL